MAEHSEELSALTRVLAPTCRVMPVSGGAVIADWKRARFLAVAAADLRAFTAGDPAVRAAVLADLNGTGCAPARPATDTERNVGVWLRAVHLSIRTLGFGRVLRLLPLLAPGYARAEPAPAGHLAALKQAVESQGRGSWLVGDDCKTEAVAAYLLLRRRGLAATLHIGMREHPFSLHAWTSSGGVCIPHSTPGGYVFSPVLRLGSGAG